MGCAYRPGLLSYKTASKVESLCPQGWSPGCKTLASETEAGRCPEHVEGRKSAPIQAGAQRGKVSCLDDEVWECMILMAGERSLGASKLKTPGQTPRNGNHSGTGLLHAAPGAKENGPLVPARWTFISNLEWATQPSDDLNDSRIELSSASKTSENPLPSHPSRGNYPRMCFSKGRV